MPPRQRRPSLVLKPQRLLHRGPLRSCLCNHRNRKPKQYRANNARFHNVRPYSIQRQTSIGHPLPSIREPQNRHPGQSHEAALLVRLVRISIAPEAQWLLAPCFSVGKGTTNSRTAPSGRRKRPIPRQNNVHAIASKLPPAAGECPGLSLLGTGDGGKLCFNSGK